MCLLLIPRQRQSITGIRGISRVSSRQRQRSRAKSACCCCRRRRFTVGAYGNGAYKGLRCRNQRNRIGSSHDERVLVVEIDEARALATEDTLSRILKQLNCRTVEYL